MKDTIPRPDGTEANLATGYLPLDENYQREAVPFIATNGFSPSASMASSVNDLAKYAKFHLSKGQTPILSGYSLRDMHRLHWVRPDWSEGYGLGVGFIRIDDWTASGHGGGYKGFLTQFRVCREHDFGVIVLTNALLSYPLDYIRQAFRWVLPELSQITAKVQVAEPHWQAYIGTYFNESGSIELIIRKGQLQVLNLNFVNDPPVILEATDDPTVFINRVPGNPGETSRFELDAEGNVTRLFNRNEYMYRKNDA
jgi:CubicO group peptidase (beta-lactamase class C family)